jgi:putative hydroxymethylpyrimidine transport system permease protein
MTAEQRGGAAMTVVRGLVILVGVVVVWYLVVVVTGTPDFILPPPDAVARSLWNDFGLLAANAGITIAEILLGMVFGLLIGCGTALAMIASRHVQDWMLPVLVASQAVPV